MKLIDKLSPEVVTQLILNETSDSVMYYRKAVNALHKKEKVFDLTISEAVAIMNAAEMDDACASGLYNFIKYFDNE